MSTKVCTKCGREHPIENFRVHKSGFVLNQCKDCEREASKARAKSFTITVKSGTYTVSKTPVVGGRRVTSKASTKVLYVQPGVSRDMARNIYANVVGVPYTGISATLVTE